jgi:hypothetical protein
VRARRRFYSAAHDVRLPRNGVKRLHHPVVGDLELTYEGLELPADPGLTERGAAYRLRWRYTSPVSAETIRMEAICSTGIDV